MAMLIELADVLRAGGLDVIEVPGWKTRGHHAWGRTSPDRITGGLAHHTAGPRYKAGGPDYPSMATVRDGMPGLPGPLAQLGLGFGGTFYVIAAGICYHSGAVDDDRYANVRCLGIEAENPGDGSPWPAFQYAAYVQGAAVLGRHFGITWRGHKEAAVPYGRKPDPTFDMPAFRRSVAGANLPTGIGIGTGYLALGDTGPRVTSWQRWMRGPMRSTVVGTVDGSYGPRAVAACKVYQRNRRLAVDGEVGPATLADMRKMGWK